MYAGDEVYGDDVTSGTFATEQSIICPDCGEREDEDDRHQSCCPHEEVENVLGFGGDPAREDPRRGLCIHCRATLHMEPDEDGNFYWEID